MSKKKDVCSGIALHFVSLSSGCGKELQRTEQKNDGNGVLYAALLSCMWSAHFSSYGETST